MSNEQINVFSFRAEFGHDARALFALLNKAGYNFVHTIQTDDHVPDVWVEVHADFDIEALRTQMRLVQDGHRMLQTLQPVALAQNTGEVAWSNS